MKVSVNWLKDYVQIDKTTDQLADMLSNLGFNTEGIEYPDGDVIIDIEVTSNRGDCLSHIGVAREIAAATGQTLNIPRIKFAKDTSDISEFTTVAVDAPDLCSRYTARIITGIKVGPSPEWIKKRLEALGVRSVNNVVDATNYAMMETGQPPHAFDYDKLKGKQIVVRKAIKGERIVSIDGTECDLDENMLVIADDKGPVAVAGVMGGLETEVSDTTTTILLEDAHFDPVAVRTASRKFAINSEASFRFERYVDTERIDWASQRTAQLIIEAAGGRVVKGLADAYPAKAQCPQITMRLSRLNKLLGIDIEPQTAVGILTGLGFAPALDGDTVTCTSPTWRHDIHREVDLIEEVIRCYGYDKIPIDSKIRIKVAPPDKREKFSCKVRQFLSGCGLYETISVSFTDADTAAAFSGSQKGHLAVRDASRKSANLLRQTLIGSLLKVLRTNYNTGNIPCRIFELADTFKPSEAELPDERTKLALVMDADFRQMRGVIEQLVAAVNSRAKVGIEPADMPWADSAGEIIADGKVLGYAGIVSKKTAAKLDLPDIEICAAEIDFTDLLALQAQAVTARPLPRFPSIVRDLSLVVDETVSWADITGTINSKATAELQNVNFIGIYRGKPIEQGRKSVTVSLVFRDAEGTLKHDTVDKFENDILDELKNKLGAQLRTA